MQLRTKESDLVLATFLYAAKCAEEGDWQRLRQMGFGEEEVQALRSLSLEELASLRDHWAKFTSIRINRDSFWLHVHLIRQRSADRYRMMQMVKLGAPSDMLAELFGVDQKEYASMRAVLGAEGEGVGRPPEPDEEAYRRVSEAWDAVWRHLRGQGDAGDDGPTDPARLQPQDWIDLAELSGQPLRTVWRVVRRWLTADADASTWPGGAQRELRPDPCGPRHRQDAGEASARSEPLPENVVALVPRTERGGERP